MRIAACAVMLALGAFFGAAPAAAQTYPPTTGTLTVSSSVVVPGQPVTVSGSGAGSGATVTITFASTPVVVATTTASAAGDFTATFEVPHEATAGLHTITATADGAVLGTVTVRVLAATSDENEKEGGLPFTGLNLLLRVGVGAGLILAGAVLLVAVRRRRAAASA
jgi:hypothetical protein